MQFFFLFFFQNLKKKEEQHFYIKTAVLLILLILTRLTKSCEERQKRFYLLCSLICVFLVSTDVNPTRKRVSKCWVCGQSSVGEDTI